MSFLNKRKYFSIFLFLCVCTSLFWTTHVSGEAEKWSTKNSDHFIIQYRVEIDSGWAAKVLRKSEYYYDKIAKEVGYSRYNQFWTYDQRVRIVIYSDAEDFTKHTNQPGWARGGAIRHRTQGAIITYKHEDGFLTGLLPHEISHLILKDFIGRSQRIPLWFDEGVAQLQEDGKKEKARSMMKALVKADKYIPLNTLFHHDIRQEKDATKAALFYIQSVSIVDFILSRYGSANFGELCRLLKDGVLFEEALSKAYAHTIDSVDELQKKWVNYMKFE